PTRPVQSESARARVMAALAFVDAVILFDTETPLGLITELKPNVLIKGAGYKVEEVVGRSVVEENGGRAILLPLVPNSSTTGSWRKCGSPTARAWHRSLTTSCLGHCCVACHGSISPVCPCHHAGARLDQG